jgi:hypothetical protein
VTLTISTSASTPTGSSSITIKGSTTAPTTSKTQTLTLNVTSRPDYTLTISNSPQSAWVNQSATFSGKLTAANSYASVVNLSCAAGATSPPPTCTPNPASVTPTASGASFTVTTSSNAGQSYSFNIVATGTDANHVTHTFAIAFNSVDFSITSTPSSQTIKPGQAAGFVLHVVPVGGTFPSTVTFSCSGLPNLSTCNFNPSSIASGSGATDIALTIATTGPNITGLSAGLHWKAALFLALPLLAISSFSVPLVRRRKRTVILLTTLCVAELGLLGACGGGASTGGGNPPPPAPVSVSILPSNASVPIGQSKQFQASVFGTSDTRVTWQVNSMSGGDSVHGTVDSNGLYRAPAAVPNPAVVSVVAVSVADSTKNASAAVNITSSASITISPMTASVALGGMQQFTADVRGVANTAVAWSVNRKTGGDSIYGTISSTGLYTAPATLPNPSNITITATSQADWRQQASATVTLASVSVTVHPASSSVFTNAQQQFAATVTGTTNTQVNWSVNGIPGGNATVGTINTGGLYTGPASVPSPATVTVVATSQVDTSKTGSASVTIQPSTPFGTFTVTVHGSGGSLSRTTNLTLKVIP